MLLRLEASDNQVVWDDWAIFPSIILSTRAWSTKVPNYRYQNGDTYIKQIALIAALSDHKELEAFAFNPQFINTPDFIVFVETLSAKFKETEN